MALRPDAFWHSVDGQRVADLLKSLAASTTQPMQSERVRVTTNTGKTQTHNAWDEVTQAAYQQNAYHQLQQHNLGMFQQRNLYVPWGTSAIPEPVVVNGRIDIEKEIMKQTAEIVAEKIKRDVENHIAYSRKDGHEHFMIHGMHEDYCMCGYRVNRG